MKYSILMKAMYEITNEMHSCIYGYSSESELFDGKILCYGKLYDSWKQAEFVEEEALSQDGIRKRIVPKQPENLFEIDYRSLKIDNEVVSHIQNFMYGYAIDFLKNKNDGDLQTLFLGCLLNLYYSSGLFDRCGIFDIELLSDYWMDEKTRKYSEMINRIYLQGISETFYWLCDNKMFTNEIVEKYLEQYLRSHDDDLLNRIIDEMNSNFSIATGFVKEYIKNWNCFLEDESGNVAIEDLQRFCPEFQFGNLLLSITSLVNFLETKGQNNEFSKYMKLLEKEIFQISLGLDSPSSLELDYSKGKITTVHPEAFSSFGLGLPYVEYISKDSFYSSLVDRDNFIVTTDIMKKSCSIYYPCKIHQDKKEILESFLSAAITVDKAKEDAERAREEKHTIIRQFSHTYMNMRATSLYNIAVDLLKNPDKQYRNYGRKLMYEYSVKQNLTKDIGMLKLRFEDNEDELCKIIYYSILPSNEDGISIQELIDESIIRCMVTLVHDGSIGAKKLREKFDGYDWISIRNSFENEILLSDKPDVKKWFNQKMFHINFDIADSWNKIVFEKDSYAALIFVNILSELLTNIFRYADKTQMVNFNFEKKDDSVMIISEKNVIKKENTYSDGTGFGLQAEADIFNIINKYFNNDIEPLVYKTEEDNFEVCFQVSDKLFERSCEYGV